MTTTPASEAPTLELLRARCAAVIESRIPTHLDRLHWDAGRLAAHQEAMLREMLAHAIEHSPFHGRRLSGIDPSSFTLAELPALPTMTKQELMAFFDDVVTDRRLSLPLVDAQLSATHELPTLLVDEYLCLTSGGSSGLRGVFVWTLDAMADFLLGMIRPSVAALFAGGGPPPEPIPYLRVAAPSGIHATRALSELFTGSLFDLTVVSATQPIEEVVEAANAAQPLILGGYPSSLMLLAEEQSAGRLQIHPLAVSGGSEPFTSDMKAKVEAAFGVAPSDIFASTEGLVGTAAPGTDDLVLSTDLAIVELVDDANRPVPPGTRSAKVLVTGLLNTTQPLIRYELTDSMRLLPPAAEHGYPTVVVEGRSDDSLRWGATTVHPITIRSVMVHHPTVREHQVRQTTDGIEVAVVWAGTPPAGATEGIANELRTALERAGLAGGVVSVRPVDTIERHPLTGKTRRFIPLP